jgi:hypothetical protein
MKLYLRYALVAFALSGLCFAQANEPAKKAAHAGKKKVSANATKEELKALEDKLNAQQQALDALQKQNSQLNTSLQQTQSQLTEAQNAARDAQSKVSALETQQGSAITKLQSDVSDVRTNLTNTATTLQTEQKRINDLEHPLSIAYKGIRITPVGFTEATAYWRQRSTQSDQATPFQSIPVGAQVAGGYNSHLSEFGITARDSRLALRVDADAGKTKLAAYFEGDFFGTGPTSNPNQTTSYTFRIRQAWGRAKFANGWTITGGQMWNLITLNRKGVDSDNANLWIPNIIEASYSVGYDWGRFGEVRIGKQINDRTAVAIAFANPSYLNQTNNTTAGVEGLAVAGNGLWGNSLVNAAPTCTSTSVTTPVTVTCTATVAPTYSTNLAPDMIAKLAFDDPRFGHFEVKGLARIFRDRVAPGTAVSSYGTTFTSRGYNNEALGWGIGGGAVVPIKPKKVDFIAQGLYGKGISRYQASGQYDFVLRNAGAQADYDLQPIKAFSGLVGIETHPRPKMELDFIVGDEYYYKTLYNHGANGYGAPSLTNTGCYYENVDAFRASGIPGVTATSPLPACTANNRNILGAQVIAYYDLYKGPMGTLRYGVSYQYVNRATWGGIVATPSGVTTGSPKGIDNIAFTTMRYIFP